MEIRIEIPDAHADDIVQRARLYRELATNGRKRPLLPSEMLVMELGAHIERARESQQEGLGSGRAPMGREDAAWLQTGKR